MKAVKKVLLSLAFPVLMFVVMLVITMNSDKCFVNGHNIFLGKDMVKQVVINSCMTVCVALAIWLQLKNGRFDFSGGASMVLAAIGAGYAGQQTGSMWTAFAVAVALLWAWFFLWEQPLYILWEDFRSSFVPLE